MPDDDDLDPVSRRNERVIPYVEDRRNTLIFEPLLTQSREVITSLAFALKNAILVTYQLEDDEVACELLPNGKEPRYILLYEAAEGGAGVLRRLLKDPQAFPRIAREALNLCHFDPDTGEDLHRAPGSTEDCEAACYDCLLSYSNQLQHPILDRKAIKDFLLEFQSSTVVISPAATPRSEHLIQLQRLCGSKLEEVWLAFLEDQRLPPALVGPRLHRSCHDEAGFLLRWPQRRHLRGRSSP